jgi:hypothetical protein
MSWGRIVLGGFLAEVILIAAVIPMRLAGSGEVAITVLAVAGSFAVFVPVAWWLARSVARPVLHGVLMGATAAAIYLVLQVLQQQFDPNAPAVPLIYYAGHALKLAGGATGGWLARRAVAPAAGTPAGAG